MKKYEKNKMKTETDRFPSRRRGGRDVYPTPAFRSESVSRVPERSRFPPLN